MAKQFVIDENLERIGDALEEIAEGVKRVTLTIQMKGTDGEQVHDENLVITDTASGTVLHTFAYTGVPISVMLAQDKTVTITGTQEHLADTGFYAPNTLTVIAQQDANVTVTYHVLSALNSLYALQFVVQANPGKAIFPVGTKVTIPWTDEAGTEWDWEWSVRDYGYYVKESDRETGTLTWGMLMGADYGSIASLPFDAPEIEEATEETAASGISYYSKDGTTYALLEITPGDAIPYDDHEAIYHNEIKDTTCNILKNGYGRWSHSAARQWCNSDADVGEWWEAQHVGDTEPSGLTGNAGFLHGLRYEDKMALTAVAVKTALNTVTDSAIGTMETTYDKVFLPCIEEMFGVPQLAGEAQVPTKYWHDVIGLANASNDENDLRKIYALNNKTSAQICRLRSANRGASYYAWYVIPSGGLSYGHGASYASRFAPACVIC